MSREIPRIQVQKLETDVQRLQTLAECRESILDMKVKFPVDVIDCGANRGIQGVLQHPPVKWISRIV
jgi:hypothetical protein